MQEHLPAKEYIAAIDEVEDILREPHHNPGRKGLPVDMTDLELGLAAYYAEDPNSRKSHVSRRIAIQQDQISALESYRPNYISTAESDRDEILNQIDERKGEIKRNSSFFSRVGSKFMTAISYVPGLDMAVAVWQEDKKAQLNHIDRNRDAYHNNPSSVKLERANRVFGNGYGGNGQYADKYKKDLELHRKHEDRKHVFELESELLDLQKELKRAKQEIKDLKNGKQL